MYINKYRVFFLSLIVALSFNFIAFSQTKVDDKLQIVGGKNIKIEDAPWQIALFRFDEQSGKISTQFCGGTIIDEYWILTAAHCVFRTKAEDIRVVASSTTLTGAATQGQIMEVAEIIVHDQYNEEPINNDIALIRLQNPLDLSTAKAKAVPIITKNDEENGYTNSGVSGIISGWGTLTYQGNQPDTLQAVTIPIIPNDTANAWFKESPMYSELEGWEVNETMIAMGKVEGGISGCHGDSGGPFVVKNANNEWAIAGITSWGLICGDPKMPSVYTRVSFYENYIMNNTEMNIKPSLDDYVQLIKYDGDTLVSICDGNMDFGKLLIRNFGKNPLSKFDIHTIIKDSQNIVIYDKTITYTFEEPLASGSSRLVSFIDTAITELGKYSLFVSLDKPNGVTVIGATPSSLNFNFQIVEATIVNLEVKVNGAGQYTYWAIYNALTQEVVQQVSYGAEDIGKTLNYSFCLKNGIYIAQIIAGDGNIDYYLTISSSDEIYTLSKRENYQGYDFVVITVPFVPIADINIYADAKLPDTLSVCNLDYPNGVNFVIQNEGSLPIERIDALYEKNGVEGSIIIDEYITSGQTTFYSIDNIKFKDNEINTFKFEVVNIQSQKDEANLSNNKDSIISYIKIAPKVGKFEVYAYDEWGRFQWTIYNENNQVVLSGNAYNTSGKYSEDLCLPIGCYSVLVEDMYGEGIPSSIGAKVLDNKGNTLVTIPGNECVGVKKFDFCIVESSVIDDIMMKNLNIYPNPANERFQIEYYSNTSGNIDIEIYDVLGNLVYKIVPSMNYGRNIIEVNAKMISNGIYNVKLNNQGKFAVKQLVINK